MNEIKDYADLKLAKKLKEYGYNEWCRYCVTVFSEDFVYDDDPGHPESHKAGEERAYHFNNKNSDNGDCTYSLPHLYDVQKWLRENHGILLTIETRVQGFYIAIRLLNDIHNKIKIGCYESYEDALLTGCKKALLFIVQHKNLVI